MTARRSDDTRSAESTRRSDLPLGPVAIGVGLIVLGLAWLLDSLGLVDLRWGAVFPAALAVVGLLLLVGARRGASGGLVAAGIVLSILVVGQVWSPLLSPLGGLGDRMARPASTAEMEPSYRLGMGTLTLDLGDMAVAEEATVEASVAMGQLEVRLPAGVTAEVTASTVAGEVDIAGRRDDGVLVRARETVGEGPPELRLDLSVGLGAVEVSQ